MVKPKHIKLQVPVELSRYAYHNGLVTPLAIYLYLKLFSDGKLNVSSEVISQMRTDLRLKDNRTFNKHIGKLKQLDWVGYNPRTKIYFIRGFDYLRFKYEFKKRRASTFVLKDTKQVQKYLVGVILSTEAIGQRYGRELSKRSKRRAATKKLDVANHSKVYSEIPDYCGLSVKRIGEILGCKQTRASVLKNAAAAAGYIQVNHKFAHYATLSKADYNARAFLDDLYPKLRGMIRVKTVSVRGVKEYHLFIQLHDEIIPHMKFKTIAKFNNLKVSPAIIHRMNRLAAAA